MRSKAQPTTLPSMGRTGNPTSSPAPWTGRILYAWVAVGLLVAWETLGRVFQIRTYYLPTPLRILREMAREGPHLFESGLVTGYEVLAGFLLGVIVAWPAALLIASFPSLEHVVTPVLRHFSSLPKITMVPLLFIWFGFGALPKIFAAALLSFFPVLIESILGLKSVSLEILDLARTMGATRSQTFLKIRLPAGLPHFFCGLEIAAPLAVVGATVGEFVGADKGLGHLMLVATSRLNTPLLLADLFVLTLMAIALRFGIRLLEKVFVPWHRNRTGSTGCINS